MENSLTNSFHGSVLKNKTVAALNLLETAYSPADRLEKHAHHLPYICFVLQGGFTEFYSGNRSFECQKSVFIFHPAGETHADSFHAATRCFNIQLNADWQKRIEYNHSALDIQVYLQPGIVGQLAARLYNEFYRQDDISALVIEGLTLEILGEITRPKVKKFIDPPRWLKEAHTIICDRFRENLTLSEIAKTVSIHETHLAREFRHYFACTIGEHIRRLRIEYCCRRLSLSSATIAEISLEAGFFDQSHFARTFKSYTGMTPGKYRRTFASR